MSDPMEEKKEEKQKQDSMIGAFKKALADVFLGKKRTSGILDKKNKEKQDIYAEAFGED